MTISILTALNAFRLTVLSAYINADVMAYGSDAEIEAEIATKITIAKAGGGYIYTVTIQFHPR